MSKGLTKKNILGGIVLLSPLVDLFIIPVMAIPSALVVALFVDGPDCDGKIFCELGGYFHFIVLLGVISGIAFTRFVVYVMNKRMKVEQKFYNYLRTGIIIYHLAAYLFLTLYY